MRLMIGWVTTSTRPSLKELSAKLPSDQKWVRHILIRNGGETSQLISQVLLQYFGFSNKGRGRTYYAFCRWFSSKSSGMSLKGLGKAPRCFF